MIDELHVCISLPLKRSSSLIHPSERPQTCQSAGYNNMQSDYQPQSLIRKCTHVHISIYIYIYISPIKPTAFFNHAPITHLYCCCEHRIARKCEDLLSGSTIWNLLVCIIMEEIGFYYIHRHEFLIICNILMLLPYSAYAIDHAPAGAGRACKLSSQGTSKSNQGLHTPHHHDIIYFFLVSQIDNTKLLTGLQNHQFLHPKIKPVRLKILSVQNLPPADCKIHIQNTPRACQFHIHPHITYTVYIILRWQCLIDLDL